MSDLSDGGKCVHNFLHDMHAKMTQERFLHSKRTELRKKNFSGITGHSESFYGHAGICLLTAGKNPPGYSRSVLVQSRYTAWLLTVQHG